MKMSKYTTEQLEAAVKAIPCVDKVHIHSGGVSFAWPFHRCNAQADGMVRVEGYPALERVLTYALRLTLDAQPTPASVAAEIRAMLPERLCVTAFCSDCDGGGALEWSCTVAIEPDDIVFSPSWFATPAELAARVAEHFAPEIAAAKRPPLPTLPKGKRFKRDSQGQPEFREPRDGEQWCGMNPDGTPSGGILIAADTIRHTNRYNGRRYIVEDDRPALPELPADGDWAVLIEDGQPAYREWRDGETIWSSTHGVVTPDKSVRKCAAYILTRRRTCGNCGHWQDGCAFPRPLSVMRQGPVIASADATSCPCWKERSNG